MGNLRITFPCRNTRKAAAVAAFVFFAVPSLILPGAVLAQTKDLEGQIEPRLQIDIPTVQFSKIQVKADSSASEGELKEIDIPWIAEYLTGVYAYAVSIAGALAAVMMMIGGFQYLTAGGDASRVSAAKKRITDALVGLVLSLGVYVVLYTVNPELVTFNALKIQTVKRMAFTLPDTFPEEEEAGTSETSTDLTTKSSQYFAQAITFNTQYMPNLEAAGKELNERTKDLDWGPATIKASGFRTIATQARLYKERCIAGLFSGKAGDPSFKVEKVIAEGRTKCEIPVCNPFKKDQFTVNPAPGHTGKWLNINAQPYVQFCPHTSGFALDISCNLSRGAIHGLFVPCHLILEEVMQKNGFCRLTSEPWHFEQPILSKSACPKTWTPGTHTEKGVTHTYKNCKGFYDSYSTKTADDTARCTLK